ncbi:hypothetical protein QJS10_CPB04g01262 [Acorus calamus]|uniref:Uncharacterized protein n=1 Tax=Acorus calamus TaxID=4465 RepID=A0AAV9F1U6_ACOCL|nr:hypothetical protein QJS10_CPB04g01262 [Acorus calamus]
MVAGNACGRWRLAGGLRGCVRLTGGYGGSPRSQRIWGSRALVEKMRGEIIERGVMDCTDGSSKAAAQRTYNGRRRSFSQSDGDPVSKKVMDQCLIAFQVYSFLLEDVHYGDKGFKTAGKVSRYKEGGQRAANSIEDVVPEDFYNRLNSK